MRPSVDESVIELYECFKCGGRTDTAIDGCDRCGGELRHLGRSRDL